MRGTLVYVEDSEDCLAVIMKECMNERYLTSTVEEYLYAGLIGKELHPIAHSDVLEHLAFKLMLESRGERTGAADMILAAAWKKEKASRVGAGGLQPHTFVLVGGGTNYGLGIIESAPYKYEKKVTGHENLYTVRLSGGTLVKVCEEFLLDLPLLDGVTVDPVVVLRKLALSDDNVRIFKEN